MQTTETGDTVSTFQAELITSVGLISHNVFCSNATSQSGRSSVSLLSF